MKLLLKKNNVWKYVFCLGRGFNGQKREVITTKDKAKAIQGTKTAKEYFELHFPELEFSIGKGNK